MTSKTKQKDNKGDTLQSIKQPYRKETYDAFVEWSLLTTKEKQACRIPTAKAFAKKHNIGESRLSKWKGRDDFIKIRGEALRLKLGEYTSDVLNGLKERCIKYGIASDVEFWLLYVEGWDRKQALKEIQEITLGPNDIRELVTYLSEEEQKMFYDTLATLIAKAESIRANGI